MNEHNLTRAVQDAYSRIEPVAPEMQMRKTRGEEKKEGNRFYSQLPHTWSFAGSYRNRQAFFHLFHADGRQVKLTAAPAWRPVQVPGWEG